MINIAKILEGKSVTNARETAYFLSRYFKGMPALEPEGKDFFADVFDREPEEEVRNATLEIIAQIEADIGRPAWDFDDETVDSVLKEITDFENGLERTVSADQANEASKFFSEVSQPQAVRYEKS